jgi:alkylation response protein AidB-like acyl-CoA dehydrogenase
MNFEFTKEQKMLKKAMREFVNKEIKGEYARDLDEDSEKIYIDEVLHKKMVEIGVFASSVPVEYGGIGGSFTDDVIIIEEFSRGSAACGLAIAATTGFGSRTILFNGNEEQKRFYLPKLARGEIKFAMALTEPAGGTDILGAISTFAVPDGDDFIINGQKVYTSCAHVADYVLTIVKTDDHCTKKTKSLTNFIVDTKNTEGIEIRPLKKFTIKGASACEIFYNNVRVPKSQILGELHNGWYHLLATLNHERIIVAAITNGIGMAALEDSVEYAKEREAFGRPIGQFQAIQHKIADSAIELELARLITYKAAWLLEQNKNCMFEAAMAKLYSSEMAFRAATRGLDIFAGYGVTSECDMQRYFRDSRQATFSPISNEMIRNFVAENLGLPKSY